MYKLSLAFLALCLVPPLTASAQMSSCSSDGVPRPQALLERFINADCESCWADPQAPDPAAGTLAIDWVVPGARGDDAPLSTVATTDGEERLLALRKTAPARVDSHFTRAASVGHARLRVAQGPVVNDYIGASIEMPSGGGPWRAWLLLVEALPAGTEGSHVARNLVRNVFVVEWPARTRGARYEMRPMQIPQGAKPERLRVVGWLENKRGEVASIIQSRCPTGNLAR